MSDVLAEWQSLINAPDRDGAARDVILHSWTRSSAAGLDPSSAKFRLRRLPRRELHARLDENQRLIEVAKPHLEWIGAAMQVVEHVIYIADRDGIVLAAAGSDERMKKEYGLLPGYDWSESTMGTNGAGTALRAGRPVAVFGEEHFLKPLQGFVCVASPIRDEHDRIIGAIDLSTAIADGHPQNLLLVAHAAFAIQRELRLHPAATPESVPHLAASS